MDRFFNRFRGLQGKPFDSKEFKERLAGMSEEQKAQFQALMEERERLFSGFGAFPRPEPGPAGADSAANGSGAQREDEAGFEARIRQRASFFFRGTNGPAADDSDKDAGRSAFAEFFGSAFPGRGGAADPFMYGRPGEHTGFSVFGAGYPFHGGHDADYQAAAYEERLRTFTDEELQQFEERLIRMSEILREIRNSNKQA